MKWLRRFCHLREYGPFFAALLPTLLVLLAGGTGLQGELKRAARAKAGRRRARGEAWLLPQGMTQLVLQRLGLVEYFFRTPAGHRSDLRQKQRVRIFGATGQAAHHVVPFP
jgi:hypothetical protein